MDDKNFNKFYSDLLNSTRNEISNAILNCDSAIIEKILEKSIKKGKKGKKNIDIMMSCVTLRSPYFLLLTNNLYIIRRLIEHEKINEIIFFIKRMRDLQNNINTVIGVGIKENKCIAFSNAHREIFSKNKNRKYNKNILKKFIDEFHEWINQDYQYISFFLMYGFKHEFLQFLEYHPNKKEKIEKKLLCAATVCGLNPNYKKKYVKRMRKNFYLWTKHDFHNKLNELIYCHYLSHTTKVMVQKDIDIIN